MWDSLIVSMSNSNSIVMADPLRFKAKIVDMGSKKILIIPVALHEQLKDFDQNKSVIVTLNQDK